MILPFNRKMVPHEAQPRVPNINQFNRLPDGEF